MRRAGLSASAELLVNSVAELILIDFKLERFRLHYCSYFVFFQTSPCALVSLRVRDFTLSRSFQSGFCFIN